MSFLYVPAALTITGIASGFALKSFLGWLEAKSWPLWVKLASAFPMAIIGMIAMVCAAAVINVLLDGAAAEVRRLCRNRRCSP